MNKFILALCVVLIPGIANAQTVPDPYPMVDHSTITATVDLPTEFTMVATFICGLTTSGSTVAVIPGVMALEAGVCDGKTNPSNSKGVHVYDVLNNVQASPLVGLKPGVQTTLVATNDGKSLSLTVCVTTCTKTQVPDKPYAHAQTILLGATDSTQRIFQGTIQDVSLYPVLSDQQVQQLFSNLK